MKKFGTPIGAGPGIANEKVGLAGVGTPLAVIGARGVACLCSCLRLAGRCGGGEPGLIVTVPPKPDIGGRDGGGGVGVVAVVVAAAVVVVEAGGGVLDVEVVVVDAGPVVVVVVWAVVVVPVLVAVDVTVVEVLPPDVGVVEAGSVPS